MKRFVKLFGIIVTVAVMVFVMPACSNGSTDDDGDDNDDNTDTGIQVYNSDETVFTGNDSGIYWFSKVLPDTDIGSHLEAGSVTITNGKLIDFSLPETIADQYLDDGLSHDGKGGNLIIKLNSGNMLRLYSKNAWGIYFYSNTAALGATIGGVSGSMDLEVGWNYASIGGDPPSVSNVANFNGYKWTRIAPN